MGRAQQQAEAKVETWEHYTEEFLAQLEFRIASIETWEHYTEELLAQLEFRITSIESHQARMFEHLRGVDRFIHKQQ